MQKLKDLFTNEKVRSALKGAAIAAAGALVPILTEVVSSGALGIYGPAVGALASIAVNAIRLAIRKEGPVVEKASLIGFHAPNE